MVVSYLDMYICMVVIVYSCTPRSYPKVYLRALIYFFLSSFFSFFFCLFSVFIIIIFVFSSWSVFMLFSRRRRERSEDYSQVVRVLLLLLVTSGLSKHSIASLFHFSFSFFCQLSVTLTVNIIHFFRVFSLLSSP